MRDLSVYYCSQCGFYAYYQLPKNAICHRCDIAMTLIEMRYQDFMNLDYEQRDKLISNQIVSSSTPYIQKICKPAALHNQREIVGVSLNFYIFIPKYITDRIIERIGSGG